MRLSSLRRPLELLPVLELPVLELLVPAQETGAVQKAITEGTNGRARMEKDRELYFAVLDGETFTFDK